MAEVLVERRDAIAVVTLNRPDRRNGVTIPMCHELFDAVRDVAASDARVVVLRGAGDHFCVGADLGNAPTDDPVDFEHLRTVYHAATLLHTMPQVTIAAIDGGCAGAGMGWAAACDFRFASDRAMFSTAFLAVGVAGDMGLAWSLNRIVGGARARELLFFPDKFRAAEALSHGLVTRLFAADRLHDETLALAARLAAVHLLPLSMMKANMLSAETLPMDAYVDLESARHLHLAAGPSLREGMKAFLKGRLEES